MTAQSKSNSRIVSGIQPSGVLHVGNYLGSLQNFVKLQDEGHECFYFIADLHSITEDFAPQEKPRQIKDLLLDMLAAGIDPKKSIIFKQSDLPEHAELAVILNALTHMGELTRMTQYKDKAQRQQSNINVGLFDYPVLMAADILIYKPHAVPVGDDQTQHLELTRKIAKRFNNRFGQTFPEPKTLYTKTPRVMSLLDPTKKMSKSLGDNHCIYLSDEPEVIKKKLSKAVTATLGGDKEMPPGVKNLFLLLENFGTPATYHKLLKKYQESSIKYQDLKTSLANAIADFFTGFRKKRTELASDEKLIQNTLAAGAKKARAIASQTLQETKEKLGLV